GSVNDGADALICFAVTAHRVPAATNAVFPIVVAAHTTPASPEIVNVNVCPGAIATGTFVQANSVPLGATCVITGVGKPVAYPVAPVTNGEIVSNTVSDVSVAVPVFVTTMLYTTGSPASFATAVCSLTTFIPGTGASITKFPPVAWRVELEQAEAAF